MNALLHESRSSEPLAPSIRPLAPVVGLGWTEVDTRPSDIEPPLLNPVQAEAVRIGPLALPGVYERVERAHGVVVFVHGPGGSHASPRNVALARALHRRGLSTLRFDLELAADADQDADAPDNGARLRRWVDRATTRLGHALAWVLAHHPRDRPRLGLFGVGTGAAAALRTAARERGWVDALVLRRACIEPAVDVLAQVTAPTLLIVGEYHDEALRAQNQWAVGLFGGLARMAVVAGIGEGSTTPGATDPTGRWAADWFAGHFDDGWDRLAAADD